MGGSAKAAFKGFPRAALNFPAAAARRPLDRNFLFGPGGTKSGNLSQSDAFRASLASLPLVGLNPAAPVQEYLKGRTQGTVRAQLFRSEKKGLDTHQSPPPPPPPPTPIPDPEDLMRARRRQFARQYAVGGRAGTILTGPGPLGGGGDVLGG